MTSAAARRHDVRKFADSRRVTIILDAANAEFKPCHVCRRYVLNTNLYVNVCGRTPYHYTTCDECTFTPPYMYHYHLRIEFGNLPDPRVISLGTCFGCGARTVVGRKPGGVYEFCMYCALSYLYGFTYPIQCDLCRGKITGVTCAFGVKTTGDIVRGHNTCVYKVSVVAYNYGVVTVRTPRQSN